MADSKQLPSAEKINRWARSLAKNRSRASDKSHYLNWLSGFALSPAYGQSHSLLLKGFPHRAHSQEHFQTCCPKCFAFRPNWPSLLDLLHSGPGGSCSKSHHPVKSSSLGLALCSEGSLAVNRLEGGKAPSQFFLHLLTGSQKYVVWKIHPINIVKPHTACVAGFPTF